MHDGVRGVIEHVEAARLAAAVACRRCAHAIATGTRARRVHLCMEKIRTFGDGLVVVIALGGRQGVGGGYDS